MVTAILNLTIITLKIVFLIFSRVIKFKQEEYEIFLERLQTIKKVLDKIVENQLEHINEQDWLSNIDWANRERYNAYKNISTSLIEHGYGIIEFRNQQLMAMGMRVKALEQKVVEVLASTMNKENKAITIAKILVEEYKDDGKHS